MDLKKNYTCIFSITWIISKCFFQNMDNKPNHSRDAKKWVIVFHNMNYKKKIKCGSLLEYRVQTSHTWVFILPQTAHWLGWLPRTWIKELPHLFPQNMDYKVNHTSVFSEQVFPRMRKKQHLLFYNMTIPMVLFF